MTEQEWIEQLKSEGYTDVRACPMPPTIETPAHTHDVQTVHIILKGDLIITDAQGTRTFRPGDRVEFPAGTTHQAQSSNDTGRMIIGVRP